MKNIVTALLFILTTFSSTAQDFAKVDATVKSYSKSFASADKLAEQIASDFTRDDEKARALFTWIATNVKYDLAAYGVNERPVAYTFRTQEEKLAKEKKFKEDLAQKTLKSKKGVCQGYATLFTVTAEKLGLEAVMVPGTSKSHPAHIGKGPGANDHAWNAVKIDGKWKLVDVTWAAGTVTGNKPAFEFRFNDKYFFADPDVFFLNHFPDDKKWLLTNKTENDFANLPLYYGSYLAGGYEFVSPNMGTFSNRQPGHIPFSVKNLKPGDKVHYSYSNDKAFREVNPVIEGDYAKFEVPVTPKLTGTLTIYINQRSVAAYRISRA